MPSSAAARGRAADEGAARVLKQRYTFPSYISLSQMFEAWEHEIAARDTAFGPDWRGMNAQDGKKSSSRGCAIIASSRKIAFSGFAAHG